MWGHLAVSRSIVFGYSEDLWSFPGYPMAVQPQQPGGHLPGMVRRERLDVGYEGGRDIVYAAVLVVVLDERPAAQLREQ